MSLNESEEEHVEIPSEGTDVWEIDPVIKVIGYCTCLSFSLYIYLLITHLVRYRYNFIRVLTAVRKCSEAQASKYRFPEGVLSRSVYHEVI